MVRPVPGAKGRPVGDPTVPMNDKFEQMRKEDSKIIKGVFRDNELHGGTVSFPFRKWKGDPVKNYTFTDGQEYEIPLAVAKHLNSGCCYEKHSYLLGTDGKPIKNPKKEHRFSFTSSELL